MSTAIEVLERRNTELESLVEHQAWAIGQRDKTIATQSACIAELQEVNRKQRESLQGGLKLKDERIDAIQNELARVCTERDGLSHWKDKLSAEIGKLAGRILDLTAERDKLLAEIGELFQLHACQRKTIEEYQTVELEKAAAPVPHIKHITIRYRGDLTHDILAKLLS